LTETLVAYGRRRSLGLHRAAARTPLTSPSINGRRLGLHRAAAG